MPIKHGLYVTATPIGNLNDLTFRAAKVLQEVDAILCEDTRVTAKLLAHLGIKKPLIPYHEHNAAKVEAGIIERLEAGEALALVSDAGTPLVSDPGFRLVKAAQAKGIPVIPIPGVSAPVTALMAAGLPPDRFMFVGFLPNRKIRRRKALEKLKNTLATLVFFESPNRAKASLQDMADIFGAEREAALCRELTKLYEEILRLPLGQLAENVAARETIKGEIVLIIGPPPTDQEALSDDEIDAALKAGLKTLSVKEAASIVAELSGRPRKELYARALELMGKK